MQEIQTEGQTLDDCFNSCLANHDCVAVDWLETTKTCYLFSQPCDEPGAENNDVASFRMISNRGTGQLRVLSNKGDNPQYWALPGVGDDDIRLVSQEDAISGDLDATMRWIWYSRDGMHCATAEIHLLMFVFSPRR